MSGTGQNSKDAEGAAFQWIRLTGGGREESCRGRERKDTQKARALRHFYKNCFIPALEQTVFQENRYYHIHQEQLIELFLSSFRQLCNRLYARQQEQQIGPISIIEYSLQASSTADELFAYRVEAYGEQGYEDSEPYFENYNAAWLYQFVPELIMNLNEQRKAYGGKILGGDIEDMMRGELILFHQFTVGLIRSAIPRAISEPQYAALAKSESFNIRLGQEGKQRKTIYIKHEAIDFDQ
ncbi:hypothetical protein SAMN04487969_101609 [Paenibacillus algorifonticola]|uniref:Uncharacterized protein n=1 Tax=Paenibacillus algorifonticola TaxID=684063 RepID=A0A1I1YKQ9_9BACL|nr:hypothetical protein [Paenibacillus algorifonticola]SFE20097.1 hypothetical protein SAMN04487969_101609 [Paenibacillus algorifonticola]